MLLLLLLLLLLLFLLLLLRLITANATATSAATKQQQQQQQQQLLLLLPPPPPLLLLLPPLLLRFTAMTMTKYDDRCLEITLFAVGTKVYKPAFVWPKYQFTFLFLSGRWQSVGCPALRMHVYHHLRMRFYLYHLVSMPVLSSHPPCKLWNVLNVMYILSGNMYVFCDYIYMRASARVYLCFHVPVCVYACAYLYFLQICMTYDFFGAYIFCIYLYIMFI